MGQVAAALTPSSGPVVAGAMAWAYQRLLGRAPPRTESWLYPLALSAFETAHWAAMWNWNAGNVTDGACKGKVVGTAGWYANPHVTIPLKFSAFRSLGEGALAQMMTLQCMGAIAPADAGDYQGFMNALENGCYAGCVPYPSLASTISGLQGTVPVPYSTVPWGAIALSAAIIGAAGAAALWIHTDGELPRLPSLRRLGLA